MDKTANCMVFIMAFAVSAGAADVYVAPGGGNQAPYDSWSKAAHDIQSAVNTAGSSDIVWVSNGVYTVGGAYHAGLTNRVSLINKTVRSVNGPVVTIIEGAPDPNTGTNGSYAVRGVYMSSGSLLSGFTVRRGYTATGSTSGRGGGVYCADSSSTLDNCIITENSGISGGGVYFGMLTNCQVTANTAVSRGGGAWWSSFDQCTISGNRVILNGGSGGGCRDSLLVKGCQITANSATYGGGCDVCTIVSNCTLQANSAAIAGGGVRNTPVSYCTFIANSAGQTGGGSSGSYTEDIRNCTFRANTAGWQGGAMAFAGKAYNCLMYDNSAGLDGGASFLGYLYNCTISDNIAANNAGGVYQGTLHNCIVYFNTAQTGVDQNYNRATMTYCCSLPKPFGAGNTNGNPRFVNRSTDNYELQFDSRCIDIGENQAWMNAWRYDLVNHPRVYKTRVDMGAYEAVGDLRILDDNNEWIVNDAPPSLVYGTDFGLLVVTSSLTHTFVVTNNGNYEVDISGWNLAGSGAAHFRVQGQTSHLEPFESDAFTITYDPLAPGEAVATLTVPNDSIASNYVVNLRGVAVTAGSISNVPASLLMAAIYLQDPLEATFSLRNTGQWPFDFTLTTNQSWLSCSPVSGVIASNGSRTITVTAKAGSRNVGDYHGIVMVNSLSATNAPVQLNVVMRIDQAPQTISNFLPVNGATFNETNSVGLSASASSSLPVSFALLSGPGILSGGANLTFTDRGDVLIAASQAGDGNWLAAPTLTNTYPVRGVYTVCVVTAYGTAAPAAGDYHVLQDTGWNPSLSGSPITMSSSQYVCYGWTMVGNEPRSGSGTSFSMTVTNDAVLTWNWRTTYMLTAAADVNGQVSPGSGWQPSGWVQVTPTPDSWYSFREWEGDVTGAAVTSSPLWLLLDRPKAVVAYFDPVLTETTKTPYWWLASYGITNDQEAISLEDFDGDGVATWLEYVADTDPLNIYSVLAMWQMEKPDDSLKVEWTGGVLATQYLETRSIVYGSPWVVIATNTPPTPYTNRLLRIETGPCWYRIRAKR